jgi:cytochrome b pre-mRNA-processing protein 3
MLWRVKAARSLAERHYAATVMRARQPDFFVKFGVADSRDGRFDLVVLHAWLVLARLRRDEAALAQAYVDALFDGFETALRDCGKDDIGLVKELKRLAEAFYGRLAAYDAAFGAAGLPAALLRNLYREAPGMAGAAAVLADYVTAAAGKLAAWSCCDPLDFGPLPR